MQMPMQLKPEHSQQAYLPEASGAAERPQVFIVSNVRLYRDGMSLTLSRAGATDVVGASALSQAAVSLAASCPDCVLVDAALPELGAAVHVIRTASPDSKVVAFGLADLDAEVIACAEAGIAGFVGCDASVDDLVSAILQARRGEFAASPRQALLLLNRVAELARCQNVPLASAPALTRREREIVPMVERGLSNKEIARVLSIEASTIKNHVHNILDKFQLRRRGEIAARVRGCQVPSF
jgi:two-component system nitrate/nitrite response regulator NarL